VATAEEQACAPSRISRPESQHGLLVLLPDLLVAPELWPRLTRRLLPLRLEVVGLTACRLRPDQFTELYAESVLKPGRRGPAGTTWLSHHLASLDMTIPLLVRSPLPVALTELLNDWKGPSGYGSRRVGDLRETGPASDRCVSLLHTADSLAELRRDAALFFGGVCAARLLAGGYRRITAMETVPLLRMYVPPGAEPHPYDVVLRSLVRGLLLLGHDSLLPSSPWDTTCDVSVNSVLQLRRRLAGQRGQALTEELAGGLRDVAAPLLEAVDPRRSAAALADSWPSSSASVLHRRAELVAALTALCQPERWSSEVGFATVDAFLANGLHLDRWEEHRLLTATSFFPGARRAVVTPSPGRRRAGRTPATRGGGV
jgi:hypothetical protein